MGRGDIRLNKEQLALIDLDKFPGGRALYEELAVYFLHYYEGDHTPDTEPPDCNLCKGQLERIQNGST